MADRYWVGRLNLKRHLQQSRKGEVMGLASDANGLLRPGEVADMFRVDPKTVTRWANDGKLSVIRTLGGHRRFREQEVMELRLTIGDYAEPAAA